MGKCHTLGYFHAPGTLVDGIQQTYHSSTPICFLYDPLINRVHTVERLAITAYSTPQYVGHNYIRGISLRFVVSLPVFSDYTPSRWRSITDPYLPRTSRTGTISDSTPGWKRYLPMKKKISGLYQNRSMRSRKLNGTCIATVFRAPTLERRV